MRIFQTFSSASVKAGTQAADVAAPGLGAVGELVVAIIALCDTVPQNRYVSPSVHPTKDDERATRFSSPACLPRPRAVSCVALLLVFPFVFKLFIEL